MYYAITSDWRVLQTSNNINEINKKNKYLFQIIYRKDESSPFHVILQI